MTRPRPAATVRGLTAVTACAAALVACTSSGNPTTTSSSGGSNPTSNSDAAPSTSTSTSAGPGSSSAGPSGSGHGSGKPLSTQTIQGLHLTYDIDIWARGTASCAAHVAGAKLVALLRGKQCTLTRSIGTTTVSGKKLGISEATLNIGGPAAEAARTATQVSVLLTSSTDNGVIDLLHDGKRLPSGPAQVPATAPGNAINSGSAVSTVRAWYLSGRTASNDPRLNEAVEDLSTI